ncbi:D-alanine--D-alanine ligase family protein [Serpentinicella sp. ANB-PHB4]|uniref:D-alanine--D-alanine ligase family protein n=1 Tax=Serpentinicella sp. ANB-PHB4 TaxID=3074076 RepID=UPI0028624EEF|nr:D-alanine--D-alanine ligase family protein [Serpentinicella sp. ANB-PHB4]MDR5659129.1 D-alanine--D-alanine ligase family protein [Serpentinicella sp. ANB-PHB4]
MKKTRIMILFGGKSGEHDISLMSAASVMRAMDKDKYEITSVGITREGDWREFVGNVAEIDAIDWEGQSKPFDVNRLFQKNKEVDTVFPVLHGPFGEDGTVQGLLEMAGVSYVGAGVLASAVAMDKGIAKMLLDSEGIPQAKYQLINRKDFVEDNMRVISRIEDQFEYPVFIKPANLGSSVGISKAKNRDELLISIEEAMKYDRRIIVETFINAREIECAVLGNENPKASLPAEVVPYHEFYDYNDKYFEGKSQLIVPANLPEDVVKEIQALALQVYKIYDCKGLSRVDFFIEKETNNILVNEVNTMPGFTKISMYPKMWEATGLPYRELIDQLINLSINK